MINARIENTDRVIAQRSAIDVATKEQVAITVRRLADELSAYVKTNKLSGQVLKVRTGNLRRSVGVAFQRTESGAVGIVSTNVKYGRAHEYGFNGSVTVKAHLRTVKRSGTVASVRGHTRNMRLPVRSFLRSALADRLPLITNELQNAVKRGVK